MDLGQYRKIGAAAIIMMISIFLSRLMGVFREMTIANIGGADAAVDAYRVAFILPEILNHILASGFLSVTFIPIFSRYLTDHDEEGGWRIFQTILTVLGLLLAGLIVLAMIFAPVFVPMLAAGRKDPQFLSMAVQMTRIVLPAQFLFFAGGLFMAVQFAKERFAIPALAPLIYNLGIIIGGLLLAPRMGMEGFAWGALAGAFAGNFLIQLLGARKVGMVFRITFDLGHPDLRRYILLTLPLMLGLTMTFSTEIFSKFFGSYLPPGAIAWIEYALRVMLLAVAFFGQAVGVASYPYLARLAVQNRLAEMNQLFNNALRYLALVIPVSIWVLVVRHEIVRILFQRGAFTPVDTQMTALALSGMLLGTVAFATQTVVNRGFYAMQNTLLPAIYGTMAVVLSLPLYWLGLKALGVLGIGLAISCSALIQVIVLFAVWNRKSGNVGSSSVYGFYTKIIAISLPIGAILLLFHRIFVQWIDTASFTGSIMVLLIQGVLFFLLAALAARLFRLQEVLDLWKRLVARLKRNQADSLKRE